VNELKFPCAVIKLPARKKSSGKNMGELPPSQGNLFSPQAMMSQRETA
jgi:hypothetical protein